MADDTMRASRRRRRGTRGRGLGYYVGVAIGAALLAAVLLAATVLVIVPRATGSVPLNVLTGSMRPDLPPGTLLIVRPVDPADIAIGDVITYQLRSGDPAVITHRVTSISFGSEGERIFTLQGDANAEADAPVQEAQIQGRLWYSVPYVGAFSSAVAGEARGWFVPVLAGLLFAYAGWMGGSALLAARRRRSTSAAGNAAVPSGEAPGEVGQRMRRRPGARSNGHSVTEEEPARRRSTWVAPDPEAEHLEPAATEPRSTAEPGPLAEPPAKRPRGRNRTRR